MKRKLALLMAAVMALSISIMPMSGYAASSNKLEGFTSLEEKTMLWQAGLGSALLSATQIENAKAFEDAREGIDLTMKFEGSNAGRPGETFELRLENAKWFFKNGNEIPSPHTLTETPGFSTIFDRVGNSVFRSATHNTFCAVKTLQTGVNLMSSTCGAESDKVYPGPSVDMICSLDIKVLTECCCGHLLFCE